MSFSIGDTVDTYRIVEELGRGGMGRVYKVEHLLTRRLEALKVLTGGRPDAPGQATRSLREIQVQARMDHPNIASVHNAFWVGEDLVLVMELIEGCSLRSLLDRGRLPLQTAVDYASQALAALSYAHANGVIHRDVSPANMMIGSEGVLKLTDFGLSKSRTDAQLSQPGAPIGSLYYMSPEQVRGAPAAEASDIYSLGAVLYEMVAGKMPFEGESAFLVMAAHVDQAPALPAELHSELPSRLGEAILRSLSKDPAQRFSSADEFRNALLNVDPAEIASASRGRVLNPIERFKPDREAIRKVLAFSRLHFPGFTLPRLSVPWSALASRLQPILTNPRSRLAATAAVLVVLTAGIAEFHKRQPRPEAEQSPLRPTVVEPQTSPAPEPAAAVQKPEPAPPAAPVERRSRAVERVAVQKPREKSGATAKIARDLVSSPPIAHSNMVIQPLEEKPKPVTETIEPPPQLSLQEQHLVPSADPLTHAPALPQAEPPSKNTNQPGIKKGLGKLWRIMRNKKAEDGATPAAPEHP